MSEFDAYLNKCKPKALPTITKQDLFDRVVRVMVKQGFPAVRRNDATGAMDLVAFGVYEGKLRCSPLLCLLSNEELTKLQKATDYGRLQAYTSVSLQPNDTEVQDMTKLKSRLELQGVTDDWFLFLTKSLLPAHNTWWKECYFRSFHANVNGNRDKIMVQMHGAFSPVAMIHHLDQGVLDAHRP